MYRVLLVDDEPIALDSLEYMLRKNRKDIEVVGKARSGRDAVEKVYNARPDIVLMDINMPGINGLEAIRRIKETNSSAQFIITTAFDYFDYAVEAMELQATEYLLKPIREAKLLEVMEKVTARVDARREQLRKELEIKEKFEIIVPMMETGFINALCMFEDSEEELQRYHYLLGITGKGGYVMIIAFEDKDSGGGNNRVGAGVRGQALYSRYREVLKATCSCIVGPIMLNRVVVYICEDEPTDAPFEQKVAAIKLANMLYQRVGNLYPEISIGIGRFYSRVEEAKKSYREALQALELASGHSKEMSILHIDDAVRDMEDLPADEDERLERSVLQKTSDGDSAGAVLAFEHLYAHLCKSLMPDFDRVKNRAIALVVDFGKRWGNVIGNSCPVLSQLLDAKDADTLYDIECRFIRDTAVRIDSGKQKKIGTIIDRANQYIQEHFHEEIALEDVARAVNLSPYYFSRFYKEETGVNFIDRLTAVRVEKAKEYLTRTEYTVKDVARAVGYADPNYFSKLFKKVTNMTATEYKESRGRRNQ